MSSTYDESALSSLTASDDVDAAPSSGAALLESGAVDGQLGPVAMDAESFAERLERAQRRALRRGRVFSVLSFDVSSLKSTDDAAQRVDRFVASLDDRFESHGGIGWLDGANVGILLPNVSLDDACELQATVVDTLPWGDGRQVGEMPVRIHFFPPYQQSSAVLTDGERVVPKVAIEPTALRPTPLWKRTLDVIGAVTGLLLLSPLLLCVAMLIKCSSRGPVLFRQQRVGYLGRPFTIFKFRTMHVTVDTASHQQYVAQLVGGNETLAKLSNDADFVFMGKLLRKAAIDELPQLLNVLRGEMSLVGPRPDVVQALDYPLEQRARFNVRPGLTGLWQVSGKNRTTYLEMIRFDVRYVQRMSLPFDLKILALTVPAILGQIRDHSA
ncbi:MAG: sugar transferase [Planctomycetales bacterium]|nr:sugar transferase [Planctomycetales bacterium]